VAIAYRNGWSGDHVAVALHEHLGGAVDVEVGDHVVITCIARSNRDRPDLLK
jgi:hypothetical protein